MSQSVSSMHVSLVPMRFQVVNGVRSLWVSRFMHEKVYLVKFFLEIARISIDYPK